MSVRRELAALNRVAADLRATWREDGSERGVCGGCKMECSTHPNAARSLNFCGDCNAVVCGECHDQTSAMRCKGCSRAQERPAMTDTVVLDAVAGIKRRYKTAMTRAERIRSAERKRISDFFMGSRDVERAARENAELRMERSFGEAAERVRSAATEALDDLRGRAGSWSDLVPDRI